MIFTDDCSHGFTKFEIGDEVSVIDEVTTGHVLSIQGEKVTLLNDLGFEEDYPAHKLVLINQSIVVGMQRSSISQDLINIKERTLPIQKSRSRLERDQPIEIDLHIEKLVDFPQRFSNHEMLQIQLNVAERAIEKAMRRNQKRLIFIHGHGQGVLRRELYCLLETYLHITYFDAPFQKYKLGATEIYIYTSEKKYF